MEPYYDKDGITIYHGDALTVLAVVARRLGCACVGIELNEAYCRLAVRRLRQQVLNFKD